MIADGTGQRGRQVTDRKRAVPAAGPPPGCSARKPASRCTPGAVPGAAGPVGGGSGRRRVPESWCRPPGRDRSAGPGPPAWHRSHKSGLWPHSTAVSTGSGIHRAAWGGRIAGIRGGVPARLCPEPCMRMGWAIDQRGCTGGGAARRRADTTRVRCGTLLRGGPGGYIPARPDGCPARPRPAATCRRPLGVGRDRVRARGRHPGLLRSSTPRCSSSVRRTPG
jgi:hypothetical protein